MPSKCFTFCTISAAVVSVLHTGSFPVIRFKVIELRRFENCHCHLSPFPVWMVKEPRPRFWSLVTACERHGDELVLAPAWTLWYSENRTRNDRVEARVSSQPPV